MDLHPVVEKASFHMVREFVKKKLADKGLACAFSIDLAKDRFGGFLYYDVEIKGFTRDAGVDGNGLMWEIEQDWKGRRGWNNLDLFVTFAGPGVMMTFYTDRKEVSFTDNDDYIIRYRPYSSR